MAAFEKKRREAEEKRLLYVAMTRARDLLVLPVGWTDTGRRRKEEASMMSFIRPFVPEKTADHAGRWDGSFLFYDTEKLDLFPEEAPFLRADLDTLGAPSKAAGHAAAARKRWQESRDALGRASAEGRPLKTATELVEAAQEMPAQAGAGAGAGAAFGSLVHRLLEVVNWENPGELERTAEAEGAGAGLGRSMVREAVEKVRQTLGSALVKRVLASDGYDREVPFAFKDGETVMEGVIDVVFREKGGVCIVDFKTDRIEEKELAARAEHYRGQMEVYSAAVASTLGARPKEAILFFLHPMKTFNILI
jgi:ATP-dependent helicase/nuclease subunit A